MLAGVSSSSFCRGCERFQACHKWALLPLHPGSAPLASKWLEFLIELAPGLQRAAMMFSPDTGSYVNSYFLPAFEAAGRSRGVGSLLMPVRNDYEIEAAITALAREGGSGLIAMPDNFIEIHRASIISAAAKNKVPAVYQTAVNARDGGLLAYGANQPDIFHRAAAYVDHVLKRSSSSNTRTPMPPLNPDVADLAPSDAALTPYDEEHAVTYVRLLDSDTEGADWREVVRIVLRIDPDREPDRARRAFESHLARARWAARHGYRHLLRRGWPR